MLSAVADAPLLPFGQVCQILQVSLTTGYRLLSEDEFPVPIIRIGRKIMCRRVDVAAFLGMPVNEKGPEPLGPGHTCQVCGKKFRRPGSHMRRIHPEAMG
jgi:predicted DNA-binding transcriptional regulator AlpA